MPSDTNQILHVLRRYGIRPLEDDLSDIDLPGVGRIEEGESIYATSLDEVFGLGEDTGMNDREILAPEDDETRSWRESLERIMEERGRPGGPRKGAIPPEAPEPHCAWYCPIHFFGNGWGIYIRERCIRARAVEIAHFIDWSAIRLSVRESIRQLARCAFYEFFMHEQFHHKVESLGFRVLVAGGVDRYRPYKANVYRPAFLTPDCIEESLANAETYRRLNEDRYRKRIDPAIRAGFRDYLRWSIPRQPPGYREGIHFFEERAYREGLFTLQSQVIDGILPPTTPPANWSIAPNMITSLCDITEEIYVVMPDGARPLFRPTSVDPGATVSSRVLEASLVRHYGYARVPGGKGSHVKLAKPGARPIILSGDRAAVSPGIVKSVLNELGGYPLSRLPDLVGGRLVMPQN